MLFYTIPLALLTSTVITFGKLSYTNAIVSLYSLGLSLKRIITPILWLSLGFSFFFLFIINPIVSYSRFQIRSILIHSASKNTQNFLKEGYFTKQCKDTMIYVEKIQNNTMKNVIIYQLLKDGNTRITTAQQAILNISETNMIFNLKNGMLTEPYQDHFYETHFETLPLILELKKENQANAPLQKNIKEMNLIELIKKIKGHSTHHPTQRKLIIQFHKKIAFSFAGTILILIGIPLSLSLQRYSQSRLGTMIFLSTSYYILIAFSKLLCNLTTLNIPLIIWLPNIVIGMIGTCLLYRMNGK